MKNFVFASALAFATIVLLPNSASVARADGLQTAGGERLAEIDIGYVKRMLRLTAEQERYWPPVESALRGLSHRQAEAEPTSFVRRLSHRVVSIVLDSAAVERLAVSARPLIAVLDDEQKRTAMTLAQQMGLGPVLAALN